MFGIGGYQPNLMNQAGIYEGMLVHAGGAALTVRVAEGLAIAGKALVEQTPADALVDIAVPAADGDHIVYLNAPGALASYPGGAAVPTVSVDVPEGATVHFNQIGGTTGGMNGRSIALARVTCLGGVITKIDNTERMKLSNIPSTTLSSAHEDTSHPTFP